MAEKTLVYLATPYSHPDRSVRVKRFDQVNAVAAKLMRDGLHIYSPISHTHPIAEAGDLPLSFDFWEKYDTAILSTCCKLLVLMLEGWQQSKGVTAEIGIAQKLNLPIVYLNPEIFLDVSSAK